MFIDEAVILVSSGKGGSGCVSFRREKCEPLGGPDGGDGGDGGNVYIRADSSIRTLSYFKKKNVFRSESGESGKGKRKSGRRGSDKTIAVPVGTIIKHENGDMIADMDKEGKTLLLMRGGRGGRGNVKFASASNQAPKYKEMGEPGVELKIELELKLLADIGIIGKPNAGKSTLISVLSNAKPKIADYPFTTKEPVLGVLTDNDDNDLVIADIPGLIEGASEGRGLGHKFLRHIERCHALIHLIDISVGNEGDPIDMFQGVEKELYLYSPKLSERERIVALGKADVRDACKTERIKEYLKNKGYVYTEISSVSRQGIEDLKGLLFDIGKKPGSERRQSTQSNEIIEAQISIDMHSFDVKCIDGTYVVSGPLADRMIKMTDMNNEESVKSLQRILKERGVENELMKAGATDGDEVRICQYIFEFYKD